MSWFWFKEQAKAKFYRLVPADGTYTAKIASLVFAIVCTVASTLRYGTTPFLFLVSGLGLFPVPIRSISSLVSNRASDEAPQLREKESSNLKMASDSESQSWPLRSHWYCPLSFPSRSLTNGEGGIMFLPRLRDLISLSLALTSQE